MARREKSGRRELEDALVRLYEDCYGRVTRYMFVRIGNQHDAEDLASETFVRALRSLDSYQERGLPMEAWIFKIAHNLVVDYIRKDSRKQLVTLDEIPVQNTNDPEEEALVDIEVGNLMQAFNQLSASHREVIALRFFSGLSSAECGRILGKKPGAVREMQRVAVKELRQSLCREVANE